MNARTALTMMLILCLAACGPRTSARPPLDGAAIGGPFALTDQDGKTVTNASYAGRYRVVYFGYTYCPDVCPSTLQVLMQSVRDFATYSPAKAKALVPIFITVDPDRDTPAVMKQYVAAFGPGLVGLTGSAAGIATVEKEFGVYSRKQPPAAGQGDYLVDHSSQAILFGPSGNPIALVPTDQGADAVVALFKQWVQ